MDWGHWKSSFAEVPENSIGFVYKITDKSNNKFYIGIKLLKKTIKRSPLKGKKRRRISEVDSDWRTYCSSSGKIKDDVEKDKSKFEFEILSFHQSKSELKIHETIKILENIYNPDCYNEMVNIRVRVPK